MMPVEKGGVVGPDLKVHGLGRLRVVDMSIIPMIPGTHTSATAYAIGEKVGYPKWFATRRQLLKFVGCRYNYQTVVKGLNNGKSCL